jgi:hypothetical protein
MPSKNVFKRRVDRDRVTNIAKFGCGVSPLGFEFGQARFDRVLPQVDDFHYRTVSGQAFRNGQSNARGAARHNSDPSSEIDTCCLHHFLDSR